MNLSILYGPSLSRKCMCTFGSNQRIRTASFYIYQRTILATDILRWVSTTLTALLPEPEPRHSHLLPFECLLLFLCSIAPAVMLVRSPHLTIARVRAIQRAKCFGGFSWDFLPCQTIGHIISTHSWTVHSVSAHRYSRKKTNSLVSRQPYSFHHAETVLYPPSIMNPSLFGSRFRTC